MKKLLMIVATIVAIVGCELLGLDFSSTEDNEKEDIESTSADIVYLMQDNIYPFESVFVNNDGACIAIKKDTIYAYIAVIDSLKKDGDDMLVVYLDDTGNIRRLYNKGISLDVAYNNDGSINLWYCDGNGADEVFEGIQYTRYETGTKAGAVLNPMDFATVAVTVLGGISGIGDAVAHSSKIGEAAKAVVAADLITIGKFSNTAIETITGMSSVAIAAIVGAGVPLAAFLAAINISYAAIQDWQNAVAEQYFGSATPVTGDAVQLTDTHFVISYRITGVEENRTDFNVGVIVADGRIISGNAVFITKNHHLYKKSVPYTADSGCIIINLEELNLKKEDRFQYRIFLESTDDNGFKWDDMMLDYWRYGTVWNLEIGEPAIKVTETKQTDVEDNNGHNYNFEFDVTASNEIPFDVDEWGVAIYETFSEICSSEDDMTDSKRAFGQGSRTMSFTVNISGVMMNTESEQFTPIINHFAVPYVSFDGHSYNLFANAVKIDLAYANEEGSNDDNESNEGDDNESNEGDDNESNEGDDNENNEDGIYRITILGSDKQHFSIGASLEVQVIDGYYDGIDKGATLKNEETQLNNGHFLLVRESKNSFVSYSNGKFYASLWYEYKEREFDFYYDEYGYELCRVYWEYVLYYYAEFSFPAISGTYLPYAGGSMVKSPDSNGVISSGTTPDVKVQLEIIQ